MLADGLMQTFIEAVPKSGLTGTNLLLAALVLVGAVALLVCERRATHPIIPLDLFKKGNVLPIHQDIFGLAVVAVQDILMNRLNGA